MPKKISGVTLTDAQHSWLKKLVAALKKKGKVTNPWAVAIAQFKKKYGMASKETTSEEIIEYIKVLAEPTYIVSHQSKLRGEGEPYRINIEAAMEGELTIETGQHFSLTENDIDAIIDNFHANVVGRKVFVDRLHFGEMPTRAPSPEFTERLGTVTEMWKGVSSNPHTKGKKTLCATLELKETGKRLVEEDAYGYSSIVLWRDWVDRRTGDMAKGPVVSSIAFTPDPVIPFLKEIGEEIPDPETLYIPELVAASRWTAVEGGCAFYSRESWDEETEENLEGGIMPKKEATSRWLFSTVEDTVLVSNLEKIVREALSEKESLGEGEHLGFVRVALKENSTTEGAVNYEIWNEKDAGAPQYQRPFTIGEDGATVSLGDRTEIEIKEVIVEKGEDAVTADTDPPEIPNATTQKVEIEIKTPQAPTAAPEITVEAASKKGRNMETTIKPTEREIELLTQVKEYHMRDLRRGLRDLLSKSRDWLEKQVSKSGKKLPPKLLDVFVDLAKARIELAFETDEKQMLSKRKKHRAELYQKVPEEIQEVAEEAVAPIEQAAEEANVPEAKDKAEVLTEFILGLVATISEFLNTDLVPEGTETMETSTPAPPETPTMASKPGTREHKDEYLHNESQKILTKEKALLVDKRGEELKTPLERRHAALRIAEERYAKEFGGE